MSDKPFIPPSKATTSIDEFLKLLARLIAQHHARNFRNSEQSTAQEKEG